MKKKCINSIMLLFIISVINNNIQAQNNFFTQRLESSFWVKDQKRVTIPEKYKTFQLDLKTMQTFLFTLPSQQNIVNRKETPIMEIPMPDGSIAKFHVWERSIMEKGLAKQFPTMKTYTGEGITDKTAVIVMDISEFGFHAMILSSVTGNVFIDQYDLETTTNYIAYYRRDLKRGSTLNEEGFGEFNKDVIPMPTVGEKFPTSQCRAATLRTYRLAVACTGEYARAATGKANPTVAQTLAKITTTVNRVVGVYELELGIHMNLVANETSIVFTNPSTDPFTGNNNTGTLINESQTQITSIIGSTNFDIGHTFSTGAGGLAGLGVVCNDAQKASGITGTTTPTGDGYDIDYVAHEMGHQFSGNHTFNSATDNCSGNGNRTPASAATNCEPGSGTTIMAYAGICGADNIGGLHQNPGAVGLQGWSDPQFHAASLAEIYKYTVTGVGNSCAVATTTNNVAPVVTSGGNFTIPINTPFILTGSATDANGDALTYSWEEIDVAGVFGAWDATPQVANIPLFRSFAPKTTGVRYFPQLDDVIGATTTAGERLPTITRAMKFRLTVRDNKAGCGGTCYADATITSNTTGGAFSVLYPNDGTEVWYEGQTKTVTWNKAGTAASPFNVANVIIELSTDGGYSYPITLLASTTNDGTEDIIVPANFTTQAKVRVKALGNVFYDMSNNDFTIAQNPVPVKWISFTGIKEKNTTVKLNWTVNEIDNHHYVIERSLDGNQFSPIGEVAAFTTNVNDRIYSFVDAYPFASNNLYRIKQVDKNGKFSYSKTISISIENAVSNWVVYPNPTTEKVNLFCNSNCNNLQIEIYDAIGKLVHTQARVKANKGEVISIVLSNLSKGAYSIKVKANNFETTTKKIVVQ
jgi:hypothetical protein